jgi:orotidine-5'-phosphate decarboxylase
MSSPIILALDTDDLDMARSWIEATADSINTYKVGLEFFLKFGAEGVATLREAGDFDLFLDLKLHDIPNTVAAAARSVSAIAPKFLTVHASGGSAMITAASSAVPGISITAVTILTSLSEEEVSEIGYAANALESSLTLATMAARSGARSIVSSPFEVAAIRSAVGNEIELITPGVRPAGAPLGDQKRVMTPAEAIAAGSNFLVIGRPISGLWSKGSEAMKVAASEILTSIYG